MTGRGRRVAAAAALFAVAAAPTLPSLAGPGELLLTGRLRAGEAEHFQAPVTTTWQLQLKWIVEEGTSVAPGDAIARFDTSGLSDRLLDVENELIAKEQQRDVQESEGELQALDLKLALARAEVEYKKAALDATVPEGVLEGRSFRERQLEAARKQKAHQDALSSLSTQETTLAAALGALQIEIERLTERAGRIQTELDELTVHATRPGIVVHEEHPWFGRKVREGDRVQATFPVARIPDLATLEVEAWVSEVDAWRLARGQRAELVLDAFPERRFSGIVTGIGRAAEPRESWGREPYFRVTLEIDGVDTRTMKPGMSVRVRVDLDSAAGAPQGDG